MVPFPTVPTDSLYKFQALGGIIALLTTITLFLTEAQKALTENIKLESAVELYNLKIKKSRERNKEIVKEFKQDSLQFIRFTKEIEREEKVSSKRHFNYRYRVNGKIYSLEEYKDFVFKNYNASVKRYNSGASEGAKISDSIDQDRILVNEQVDLVQLNFIYLITICVITTIVVLASGKFIETGFKKWKTLQTLSDELAELQVKKARKEDEGSKPKLILPD
jgi:hypothetical protein